MIEVYGKDNCPQCDEMVHRLDAKNVDYKYYKIGKDVTREEVIAKCEVPARSMPVVFNDGKQMVGSVESVAAKL